MVARTTAAGAAGLRVSSRRARDRVIDVSLSATVIQKMI
jgi:hypothetical protein